MDVRSNSVHRWFITSLQLLITVAYLVMRSKYYFLGFIKLCLMCYYLFLELVTGRQLKAARNLLGWEQIYLAKRARVSIGTIRRMEKFDKRPIGCRVSTMNKVRTAMEEYGVNFDTLRLESRTK